VSEDHGSQALRRLLAARPHVVLASHAQHGDVTAVVEAASILETMRFLHDDPDAGFDVLVDLTAVDWPEREPRFEVVYHLLSMGRRERLRVKAGVAETPCEIDSIVGVWPAANWMEREVWDMYGIRFRGHPDLRRLLLYEEFEGHPLRKDYPKERRQPLIGPRN
jgi:NADH-quinone oxidoreductase subunit C